MAQQLAFLTLALQKVLAELDEQQLHLPAIYVARALEAIENVAEDIDLIEQPHSDGNDSEIGVALN
jgi:hypothetical protein